MYTAKNCLRLGWFFFVRTTTTRLYWQIIDRLHYATLSTNSSISLLQLCGAGILATWFSRLSIGSTCHPEGTLALKQAMKQDTKLIRVDLDFKNAFNSVGNSSLWKILESFGVPDVSLLSSIYEHCTMRIQVGRKSPVGHGNGTGLCSLPPPVRPLHQCPPATPRLYCISHRVRGVPDWNHQAFADDLSLYVSSTDDANTLLDIVSEF